MPPENLTRQIDVRRTSDWVAAVRAEEYAEPDRFVHDPYASALADEDAFAMMRTLRKLGAPAEIAAIRARIGDEALRHAVERGVRQAVSLGAGSDTRAWRAQLATDFHYFELDLPGQSAAKARLIEAATRTWPTCRWHPVEADLRADWSGALVTAGLRTDEPVCWLVEGLVFYLPVPALARLVDAVGELSAAGSTVVGDVAGATALAHPPYQPFLDQLAAMGIAFTAHDDLADRLARAGWDVGMYGLADLRAGSHPLLTEQLPDRLATDLTGFSFFYGTTPM